MEIVISPMEINDYEEVLRLWKRCEGIGLSGADEHEPIERFLIQNQGLCFTARIDGRMVGTSLCGSDGRRGYLYHLAVDSNFRKRGIGKMLAERSLSELSRRGIQKCHLMVFADNLEGQAFWSRTGWVFRPEILTMSKETSGRSETESCPC